MNQSINEGSSSRFRTLLDCDFAQSDNTFVGVDGVQEIPVPHEDLTNLTPVARFQPAGVRAHDGIAAAVGVKVHAAVVAGGVAGQPARVERVVPAVRAQDEAAVGGVVPSGRVGVVA